MRRALVDGYVQRGTRATSDRRVRTDPRVTRAEGTFWLLRRLRASAQEKAGPIREGVEDRGLGLGTIREQRGRGNVMETTDCGAYVASAWADIHRAWVKEASLGKDVQAVCKP